jgi:hypothetical protein
MAAAALHYCHLRYWAPASAGEGQGFRKVEGLKGSACDSYRRRNRLLWRLLRRTREETISSA